MASLSAGILNVTSFGASANGTTDSTQAIQNAVNSCNIGDTVVFPAGTYVVNASIGLKSNCTYSGQGAVLQGYTGTGPGGYPIFRADYARQNITITGFTFNGGGIDTSGGSGFAKNIVITGNTFENLVNTSSWYHTAVFDGFGFDHSTISQNTFTNIADGGQLPSANYDESKTGIGFYHANYLTIDSNTFDFVNEGIHLAYDPSYPGAWGNYDSLKIANNVFTRMHRIPIEIQSYYMTNTVISGNRMSNYYNPNENSYGISFASDTRGTIIDSNDMDSSVPAASRYGYCVEAWGTGTRTTNNMCRASATNPKGQWVSDVTLGYFVTGSTVVQNNTFCGIQPVAWGQISFESWWQAGYAPPPTAGQSAAVTSPNSTVSNCGAWQPADKTAPTVAITSPANGTQLSGTIAVTASASDNVGVTKVEFYVDSQLAATTTGTYSYTWNAAATNLGNHTLTAKAYDAAGNTTSAAVGVSVVAPPSSNSSSGSSTGSGTGTITGSVSGTSANVITNGTFFGNTGWTFYTNALGTFSTASGAGVATIWTQGSNVQLYQSGIPLQPNQCYALSFWAMSNSGHDLAVSVQKHTSPYTSYGLNRYPVNLTARWQIFNVQFTTSGFSSPVSDGRLMFWLADTAAAGDIFTIDNVVLKTCN